MVKTFFTDFRNSMSKREKVAVEDGGFNTVAKTPKGLTIIYWSGIELKIDGVMKNMVLLQLHPIYRAATLCQHMPEKYTTKLVF